LNRNPKHRLGANRDAQELKEHPFFKNIDWVALSLKQVTPPFKPNVESDESTANFDPEFTEADIDDLVDLDGDGGGAWPDEGDPSEEWTSRSLTSGMMTPGSLHTPNGPLGSDRRKGSNSSRKSNGGTAGIQITGMKNGKKRNGRAASGESVLSNSMQENFRGFTFSGGESVSVGVLSGRAAKEDALSPTSGGESGGEESEFEDFAKSVGRFASKQRKGFGFTELP
jgi:serine/threonine protein kinase SCH9